MNKESRIYNGIYWNVCGGVEKKMYLPSFFVSHWRRGKVVANGSDRPMKQQEGWRSLDIKTPLFR